MKKILLLLLLSVTMYGQVPADATPLENIQITNNVQDLTTDRVSVPTSEGVINWKYAKDLIIPAKAYLSTGLIKNGAITINGDPTKFNVTAGIGIISNFDDPENPISTIINFPAFTGVTPTYLTTGNITYVAINSTPAIVMQATPFTAIQRRDLIELGAVIHSNLTTINVINNLSSPTEAGTNQLHDLFDFIGALNLSGNVYSANGANLQLNKSAGIIGKRGVNFINNWKDPHRLAQAGETALTFRYRTQNGTEGSDRVNLDPTLYDLNNVLTAVPNNKFTIQTVVMFQTGLTRILYGQNFYDDLQSARNAIFTRSFVIEPNSKENGIIRSYIIMRNTTTSLQNVADASILEAQKFGGVASGGVALTLANIVTALGYTPENVANKSDSFTASSSTTYSSTKALVDGLNTRVTTTGTTGNLQRIVGTNTLGNSALTDNGTTVVSSLPLGVSGSVTGTSFIKSAATATNILLAGGTDITQASLFVSPTLTGVPLAPTATSGTNTTQIATTAFVTTADAGNVKLTGNQIITGDKSFNPTAFTSFQKPITLGPNGGFIFNENSTFTYNNTNAITRISDRLAISSTLVSKGYALLSTDNLIAGSNKTFTFPNEDGVFALKANASSLTATSFINSSATATNALLAGGTTLANPISGTGTTGYLPKFTSAGVIGNGMFFDNGTNIGLGTINPISAKLQVTNSSTLLPVAYLYNSNLTAGQSRGVYIEGGTNSTDYSLVAAKADGSKILEANGSGNVLINNPTDNGVDKLQVNGSANFASSVTANKFNSLGSGLDGGVNEVISLGRTASTLKNRVISSLSSTGALNIIKIETSTGVEDVYNDNLFVLRGDKIGIGLANPTEKLDVNGSVIATDYKISTLNTAPSSATATGTTGEIRITAGFIYVCTATNTWVRTALATW